MFFGRIKIPKETSDFGWIVSKVKGPEKVEFLSEQEFRANIRTVDKLQSSSTSSRRISHGSYQQMRLRHFKSISHVMLGVRDSLLLATSRTVHLERTAGKCNL